MTTTSRLTATLLAAAFAAFGPLTGAGAATTDRDRAVPHYDHVIVIVEENKGYSTIIDRGLAPNIAKLAHDYGTATQMYAEAHPSEPNYVALVGGDTFGIQDDDAWYCVPGSTRPFCKGATKSGYVAHLIDGPSLGTQLLAKGLEWRGYMEDIPEPGSLAIMSSATATKPPALYAAKHTAFTNFKSTIDDANRVKRLVGFDQWNADIKAGTIPAFSLVVPNQCNEMHGMDAKDGANVPDYCADQQAAIRRGDQIVGDLVAQIQASPVWTAPNVNTAIVITFDEDGHEDRVAGTKQSCCVADANNPGGGHIATVVATNHGPRGVTDTTEYNHYSLLRTIEDAFGLDGHLRHADDTGVVPMTPLFAQS